MAARPIIKLLLHLLPLLPLLYGYYYLAAAAALFVAVFYIKVFKLTKQLELFSVDSDASERQQLTTVRDRWKYFTYLH